MVMPWLAARSTDWPSVVAVAGVALVLVGTAIAVAAVAALGQRSLSAFPKPRTGSVLVRRGAFGIVRHPIYSGLTLFILGWGLAWSSLVSVALALVLLVFFDIKARREERWLQEKFPDYAEYKQQVRKLIPFVY
jgi:protein-S-isoprenylcysteine O-methyltransferase Ste14